MPQTTVLLGAGASVDAGLPMSGSLTKRIAEAIHEDPKWSFYDVDQALHQAIGAIIAHDTQRGASPFETIDVERLFSAIKMLSERETLEISPFVDSWRTYTTRPEQGLPMGWGSGFVNALKRALNGGLPLGRGVDRSFQDGVLAILGSPKLKGDGIYKALTEAMLEELKQILAVKDPQKFGYLSPLFTLPDPISIATLNYDMGIELAATQNGIDLDVGIDGWDGGFGWSWRDGARARLLKLHGSLDWELVEPAIEPQFGSEDYFSRGVSQVIVEGNEIPGNSAISPGLIFGAREKLRSDGPFLAMLFEFSAWLRDTEHLIIVGYSFRDDHINHLLSEWLQAASGKLLTIVDPGFPSGPRLRYGGLYSGPPTYQEWLAGGIYMRGEHGTGADAGGEPSYGLRDGFRVFRGGANQDLGQACNAELDLQARS